MDTIINFFLHIIRKLSFLPKEPPCNQKNLPYFFACCSLYNIGKDQVPAANSGGIIFMEHAQVYFMEVDRLKRQYWIGGFLALLIVAAVSFGMWCSQVSASQHVDPAISQFAVDYTVEPVDFAGKLATVTIQLTPEKLSADRTLYLDASAVDGSKPKCTGSDGAELTLNDLGSVWEIGPLPEGCETLSFTYDVKLGERNGEDFQVEGNLYEDLMVFQGKKVLMIPWFDSDNAPYMDRYISRVSFRLQNNPGWSAIMPFAETNGAEAFFQLDKPTWYDFYDISNSSFCFGSFEPLNLSAAGGTGTLYLDKSIDNSADVNDLSTVVSFYNYYAGVFGEGLSDMPLVLLRSAEDGESVILGGVGGKSAAISLSMLTPGECQTMSRTIYHAFFDSKIYARNLHFMPNQWLYKGLESYYLDDSASALPLELKERYGIEVQDDMNRKYMKYLFFSLKDPILASLSSDQEDSMVSAQQDFYYNVKVPLILHTIEKYAGQDKPNALLRYLQEQTPRQDINVSKLMKDLLGKDEMAVRAYFSGSSYIPNYWDFSAQDINQESTVELLSSYEDLLSELYQEQYVDYPYDPVFLINIDTLNKEIADRKLSFSSPEMEAIVKDYSETVYLLLMQNALRASLCGIEDPGAAGVKAELNSLKNGQKWTDYVSKVGYAK